MNLTEAMVASLVWGLTAVGVLQMWSASGHALAEAQKRQQALEMIDVDLLRFAATLQRQRSQLSGAASDCGAVLTAWSLALADQPLARLPGLSRRYWREGEALWISYTYSQGSRQDERRRLLAPEAFGLCSVEAATGSALALPVPERSGPPGPVAVVGALAPTQRSA
ncbi:MAG: hypothetical protein ACKOCM_01395 [Cyanobacteriota bacterium]